MPDTTRRDHVPNIPSIFASITLHVALLLRVVARRDQDKNPKETSLIYMTKCTAMSNSHTRHAHTSNNSTGVFMLRHAITDNIIIPTISDTAQISILQAYLHQTNFFVFFASLAPSRFTSVMCPGLNCGLKSPTRPGSSFNFSSSLKSLKEYIGISLTLN